MILYLSGIDCSGKSTLAKKLGLATGAPVIKYSIPKEGDDFLAQANEEMHRYENNLVIYDRGMWGCFCYQDVIEQHQIPLEDILAYAKEFTNRGNMILWVDASTPEIIKRLKKRGDKYIKAEDIEKIHGRYYQLFKYFDINKIPYYKITT